MAHLARLALRPSMLRASASSRPTASAASLMAVRSVHVSRTAHAEVVDKDPQLGDYPQPPMESTQTRRYDPRYWDGQEKKNFGETLHEQDDILGVWAPDIHQNVNPASAARQILIAFSCFAALAGMIYVSLPQRPALPRTYPREGLANELGGTQAAALADGAFDKEEGEGEEEEEE